jgi:signal transduction histidine kinase/ligand-binding sensor domain-containing protein
MSCCQPCCKVGQDVVRYRREPGPDRADGEGHFARSRCDGGTMGKLGGKRVQIALFLACLISLLTVPGRQTVLARSAENAAGVPLAEESPPVPARAARFDMISMADGLPDDVVYSILQDRQGFMWFGTGNGLTRYDGYQFTVYQSDPSDPTTLSHDTVYTIYQARNGDLWVGTGNGLDRFDPTTGAFTHYVSGYLVLALYEDEAGILWIGTSSGLTKLDPADPKPSTFSRGSAGGGPTRPSGDIIYAIVQDRAGEIWLGTGAAVSQSLGLDRFDQQTGTFVHYQHDPADAASLGRGDVQTIFQDRQGGLWVGTTGGLNRLDISSQIFTHYQHDPDDPFTLVNDWVLAVLEDSAGRLWIGTAGGLDQFDRSQNRFIHYRHDRTDVTSVSGDMILALYEDRSGVVWIGTTAGLSRYDETASQFTLYQDQPDSPYRLSDDVVLAVCEDRNGELWVGTAMGGLNRLDREAGTVAVYRHDPADPTSLSSDGVTALYEDRAGDLWVGTDNRWLERFDPLTETFVHYWYLSAGEPRAIVEGRAGDLWIGTPNGLYRLNRTTQTATHYRATAEPALSDNRVTAIFELQDGRLLVGTEGGGVNVWDPATEQFSYYRHNPADPNSLAHNSVYAFYEGPNEGVVWIGTWNGLDRIERTAETATHYTEKDGLSGNAVLGIVVDSVGMLWLTTNRGLSRFDPRTETFRNYDAQDGLPASRFVQTAVSQSRGGEILIGSSDGLVAFYPDRIPGNPSPPPIAITTLSLFNEVIRRDLPPDEPIVLSYKQNFLSFEFAALDYTAPEKNQYAYRLEGVDPGWVQAGTRRRADYPNLRPGNYVFRVKGANNAGVWNEAGTAIPIIITPPFRETWWFRGLVLLVLLGAVLGAYRLRVRSIEARSRELERQVADRTAQLSQANVLLEQESAERIQVEQALRQSEREKAVVDERNRLARELHDSVAQSMYGVTLLAEVVSQLLSAGRADQVAGHLEELKDTAKESLAEMRLLIYELRPTVLEEEGLASALQARLEAVENRAGLETEFHLASELTLGSQAEEALFRIAQEALNNVLKHAQARCVTVSLGQTEHSVTLEIADDGTGFDPSKARRGGGLGLRGMGERAAEIGARLEIESAAGSGTLVRVVWERGSV